MPGALDGFSADWVMVFAGSPTRRIEKLERESVGGRALARAFEPVAIRGEVAVVAVGGEDGDAPA
jgi:hypothetical protein